MAIAGGGLSIIQKLYSELDDDFKSVLENDLHAQSMYELLKLPNAHVISPFILAVLHHYDEDEQCFRFGEKILTITLEDVLYIIGLPIFGKPVICDGSYKKDIFLHIFPSITSSCLKRQNRISMDELRGIAKNTNIDEVQRKRAVLLTLAYNIITPSSDGHGVPPNLASYFDDVEDVDNYAWGASLLSVLYSSLKKYKKKEVKKLDGNLWVVLAFFLIRIPMLANTLNVKLALTTCKNVPLLHHIVERVRPVSFNHKLNHKRFEEILEELIDEPTDLPDSESKIIWKPYVPEMLPPRLQGQKIHVTLMAPLFYNGCVLRHEPEKCPRQLDINPSLILPKRKKIKQTKQKGDHARDMKDKYKKELEEWNAYKLAGAVTAATTSADILGTNSPPHASSSGAKLQMPARDINTRDINTVIITYKRKKKINVSQDAPEYVKAEAVYNKDADSNDAKAQPRKRCKTDACEKKKKLLVLDLNGLLVDVVDMRKSVVEGDVESDLKVNRKEVFKRPHCDEFLKFCFEKFEVGIWTSRMKKNMDPIVDYIFGDNKSKLKFLLDQAACTKTGINTFENPKKPLFLKELKKIWNSEFHMPLFEKGKYDESNTILLDDSPCKALLNPPYTAVFPPSYKFHNASTDKSLGPEGDLYIYLGKLAEAENVPKYVENNMFGNMAITEKHEHWSHYIDINEKVYSNIRDKRADGRGSYPRARLN